MTGTALILGRTGRFGRHAAEAFRNAGWHVRFFNRSSDDLVARASGVDVIVNGLNPPYPQWAEIVPEITARIIAAAKASGATVLVPGNVYVYGPDSPELLHEKTIHLATNPLARTRIEMETAYRDAGVPTILLRAGDFIDTRPSRNWFDLVVGDDLISYPGRLDAAHAWAFLPDLARAATDLAAQRDSLDLFEEVPFPGYTLTGSDLATAVGRATDRVPRVKQMTWLPLQLAQPFWPMAKGLLEMRYLWNKAHRLDGTRFATLLPDFAPTPLTEALATALSKGDVHPDETVARSLSA